jgi:hypothetical protein
VDKSTFAKLKETFSAITAAFASAEAGEPEYEAKIQQAFAAYDEVKKGIQSTDTPGSGAPHTDEAQDKALIAKMLGESQTGGAPVSAGAPGAPPVVAPGAASGAKMCASCGRPFSAGQGPHEETVIPEAPKTPTGAGGPASNEELPSGSAAHFSAQSAEQARQINELKLAIATMAAKDRRVEFENFCAGLLSDGHQFDLDNAKTMFSAASHDAGMVKSLLDFLKKSPKNASLSKMAPQSAGPGNGIQHYAAGTPGADAVDEAELRHVLSRACPGMAFSAEDINLGRLLTSMTQTE